MYSETVIRFLNSDSTQLRDKKNILRKSFRGHKSTLCKFLEYRWPRGKGIPSPVGSYMSSNLIRYMDFSFDRRLPFKWT